jgi:hypothetical protein
VVVHPGVLDPLEEAFLQVGLLVVAVRWGMEQTVVVLALDLLRVAELFHPLFYFGVFVLFLQELSWLQDEVLRLLGTDHPWALLCLVFSCVHRLK